MKTYRFTGRRLDAETGLSYFRARYFDHALGRFIGRDPCSSSEYQMLGDSAAVSSGTMLIRVPNGGDGYQDGYSLYRGWFVPGSIDPSGLKTCCKYLGTALMPPNEKDIGPGFMSDALDAIAAAELLGKIKDAGGLGAGAAAAGAKGMTATGGVMVAISENAASDLMKKQNPANVSEKDLTNAISGLKMSAIEKNGAVIWIKVQPICCEDPSDEKGDAVWHKCTAGDGLPGIEGFRWTRSGKKKILGAMSDCIKEACSTVTGDGE